MNNPALAFDREEVQAFCLGYAMAILFTENDNMDEGGGEPLDVTYGVDDIDDEARRAMDIDCEQFIATCRPLLAEAIDRPTYSAERAGHDFWLTRQGHGVGYEDRPELRAGDLGDRLGAAARAYGQHYGDIGVEDDLVQYGSPKAVSGGSPSAPRPRRRR